MFWRGSRPTEATPPHRTENDGEPDDAALVTAARADPRAFAPLYQRYLGPIYRYCSIRLASRELAEVATSEIFAKALAGLGSYRNGLFAAWLFRIAHNVVADMHRRHQPTEPIEAAGDPADPAPDPEVRVLAAADQTALWTAVAALPADQRAAIELKLAGWSGEQIAAALDRSPDAVKMLRLRALKRLRMRLIESGEVPTEVSR